MHFAALSKIQQTMTTDKVNLVFSEIYFRKLYIYFRKITPVRSGIKWNKSDIKQVDESDVANSKDAHLKKKQNDKEVL